MGASDFTEIVFCWKNFEVGAKRTILSAESTIKQLVSLIESGKDFLDENKQNNDTSTNKYELVMSDIIIDAENKVTIESSEVDIEQLSEECKLGYLSEGTDINGEQNDVEKPGTALQIDGKLKEMVVNVEICDKSLPSNNIASTNMCDGNEDKGLNVKELNLEIPEMYDVNNQETQKASHYQCDQCNYKTTNKQSLARHIKSIHGGITYDCSHCVSKESLSRHVKSIHEGLVQH